MSLEEAKKDQDHELKLSDVSLIMDDDTAKKLEGLILDYQGMSFVMMRE